MQNVPAINPNTTQKVTLLPINTNKPIMQKQITEEKSDSLEISQKEQEEKETFIDKIKKNKKFIILAAIGAIAIIGTIAYILKRKSIPADSSAIEKETNNTPTGKINDAPSIPSKEQAVNPTGKINDAPAIPSKEQTVNPESIDSSNFTIDDIDINLLDEKSSKTKYRKLNLSSKRKASSRISSKGKKTILNSKEVLEKSNICSQESKKQYDEILAMFHKANENGFENFSTGNKTITFEQKGDGTIEMCEKEADWLRTSIFTPLRTKEFKIESVTETGTDFSRYWEYENGKISKISNTSYKDKTEILKEFYAYGTNSANEAALTRYERSTSNLSNSKSANPKDEIFIFGNKGLSGYEKNEPDYFLPLNSGSEQIEFENGEVAAYRRGYEGNTYKSYEYSAVIK